MANQLISAWRALARRWVSGWMRSMPGIPRGRRAARVAALLTALCFITGGHTLRASPLNNAVFGMFPRDVSGFGFADLSSARGFGWFAQLEAQLVPVSVYAFEGLLDEAQRKSAPSIEQVAWARLGSIGERRAAPGDGELVGVMRGQFDLDQIETFLDSRHAAPMRAGRYNFYSADSGAERTNVYFALIDSETIAFGPLEGLERMLAVLGGEAQSLYSNERVLSLVSEANAGGIFWGVVDGAGAAAAFQRIVPEVSGSPQAAMLLAPVRDMVVTVSSPENVEVHIQATCGSSQDALLLSQLLQAGLLYRSYRSRAANPELSHILDGISVSPSADLLELGLHLTDDQLLNLIEHNTFSTLP